MYRLVGDSTDGVIDVEFSLMNKCAHFIYEMHGHILGLQYEII